MTTISDAINDLYQRESSKILATLLRVLGTANMALAEDLVQETFSRAVQHWQKDGLPEVPSAWLMLTAKRAAIDYLRQHSHRQQILKYTVLPSRQSEWALTHSLDEAFSMDLIEDDQLRLLFWISSSNLTPQQRIPLALKALCGMSVDAIARALLSKPDTIKKRLTRAKQQLTGIQFEIPADEQLASSLDNVYLLLYLLFNEGISAHNPKPDSRVDVCASALGFMRLIIAQPRFRCAESSALTALMHFHTARLASRFDLAGLPLTLAEQDRTAWLKPHLKLGMSLLQRALDDANQQPSRYLLEALIAFEHCRASSFAETNWQTIVQHYQALLAIDESVLHTVSAAVAFAHVGDSSTALALLDSESVAGQGAIQDRRYAAKSYIYWQIGQHHTAREWAEKAKEAGLPALDYETLIRNFVSD